jgi:LPS export ABC transporter protein LptC
MLKEPRNLLWILPLAALISFPLWKPLATNFLSPERSVKQSVDEHISAQRESRSAEMLEIDFMQNREGRKEWQIKASRLFSMEDEKHLQLEEVEALFFGKAGKDVGQTRINSRRASYEADRQLLILQDDVIIKDDKGYEIQTDSLDYHGDERKIRTNSGVKITGHNIKVSGDSLIYNIDSGNYRLDGNIVCKVW